MVHWIRYSPSSPILIGVCSLMFLRFPRLKREEAHAKKKAVSTHDRTASQFKQRTHPQSYGSTEQYKTVRILHAFAPVPSPSLANTHSATAVHRTGAAAELVGPGANPPVRSRVSTSRHTSRPHYCTSIIYRTTAVYLRCLTPQISGRHRSTVGP